MTITLNDIARRANVSIGVVSDVIKNKNRGIRVSDDARERILKTVAELDYYPNTFARSLKIGRSYMIGVILSDISDPYYGDILRGVESMCISHGYHYLLSGTKEEIGKQSYLEIHKQRGVEGILVAGTSSKVDNNILINKLLKKNFPIVVLNRKVDFLEVPTVVVDNLKGASLATRHLIELGHKRIGCIRGEMDRFDSFERWKGYKETLGKFNLTYDENLVVDGSHTLRGGYESMKKLLFRDNSITAVFSFNDMSAIGVMKACKEEGLKIPDDISIVGFDDIAISEYCDPPLTTIRQPILEMGKKAVSLLIESIEKKGEGVFSDSDKKIIFDPELVVRDSTGVCSK